MTHTRRLWALLALVLILVLAACSTPDDLNVPTLEPQFGTTYDDKPVDVAVGPASAVYGLYNYVNTDPYYDEYGDYYYEYAEVAMLTRYNATGGVVWQRAVFNEECYDYYFCDIYRAEAVFADANNYTYVLVSDYYGDEPDGPGPNTSYTVQKYAPLGELVGTFYLGYFESHKSEVSFKLAVDSSGNLYVVSQHRSYYGGNSLTKYTSTGELVWTRSSNTTPPYGTPTNITVSSSGSIYIVGTKGFSRYSSSGDLVWNKTGTFEQVAVSGSYIYTRNLKDVRKWDGTGKQLWLRTQSGLNTLVLQDIDGDGSGNVYLSGKYQVSTGNMNAMVRKLNASGSVLWTKTYGTSRYDDAIGIATATGSEIYTIGETQGSLAHPNYGGPQNRDGYLRRQTSTGGLVWMR